MFYKLHNTNEGVLQGTCLGLRTELVLKCKKKLLDAKTVIINLQVGRSDPGYNISSHTSLAIPSFFMLY